MEMQTETEERIINAAIACIEQYGLQGTTIRRIAQAADLNSAAISYYFRSKDRLLEKAMEVSLLHAFDWNDYQTPAHCTAQERIEIVLLKLVEGAYAYPRLTRAHFYNAFAEGDYSEPGIKKLNQFFEELLGSIRSGFPHRSESDLRLAITQIAADAFLLPAFMPHLFDSFSGCDLTDRDTLRDYIRRAVERLL